jgi:hypothetical protein
MLNIPLKFETLLDIIDALSAEQKQIIRQHLDDENALQTEDNSLPPRILGLHPGAIWTSDDFDDPLPDEFWLGKDA